MQSNLKRIIGLDVGLRRIGIALSDPLGITAQGLPTLWRKHMKADLAELSRIARDHEAAAFVVGHPLHMSGRESRQGHIVQEFAERLRERSGLPVTLWDERLTTVVANQVLRESGIGLEKRNKAVDQLSAVLILQSYLDSLPPVDKNTWEDEREE